MDKTVPILIPAAGASRRMRGRDKLTEMIGDEPLLRRQARVALAAGAPVIVTLPEGDSARSAVLDGLEVQRILVPDAAEGMAASLRAGVAALPAKGAGVLILLADLPEIETADLRLMFAAFAFASDPKAPILRATDASGLPGHPVLFPADLFAELRQLSGDGGARSVIAAHRARLRDIALPGKRATTDLDTPEAWAAWRATRSPAA